MKLLTMIHLLPTESQTAALDRTIVRVNEASQYVSDVVWSGATCRCDIKLKYAGGADGVRVIARVADLYKLNPHTPHLISLYAGITYDSRIISILPKKSTVSIWTLDGRQTVRFVASARSYELLESFFGDPDLVKSGDHYILSLPCLVENILPGDIWF